MRYLELKRTLSLDRYLTAHGEWIFRFLDSAESKAEEYLKFKNRQIKEQNVLQEEKERLQQEAQAKKNATSRHHGDSNEYNRNMVVHKSNQKLIDSA